jgi:hypothetical protein
VTRARIAWIAFANGITCKYAAVQWCAVQHGRCGLQGGRVQGAQECSFEVCVCV